MSDKPSFQDAFFSHGGTNKQVLFAGENEQAAGDETETEAEQSPEGESQEQQSGTEPKPSKKESRRARPPAVQEKQLLREAHHWKSTAVQEAEKARAMEQQNLALHQQLAEKEEARRASELKALAEREDNLRLQRKIALAAGEQDYAEDVSTALTQTAIQKEFQKYDRHLQQTQPRQSHYEEQRHQQQNQSPMDQERIDAFDRFCARNPWYSKNPKLTQDANALMEELTNILQLEQRDEGLYSDAYFEAIEQTLKEHHGVKQPPASSSGTASQHYDQPNQQRPSTRFSDAPRGNTMAEEYAHQSGGGKTFTPEEVSRTGSHLLQMKVGKDWVSGQAARVEADKHRKKIVLLGNKGFRINFQ